MILSEKKRILSLYRSGNYTENELASKFGIAQSTMSYIVQDANIEKLLPNSKILEKIRSITDIKSRLIESAKFSRIINSVNKRTVASIANTSDCKINRIFGTFLNLLIESGVYKGNSFAFPSIEFSKYDVRRNILLPEEITILVGEFPGIHAGDGSAFITHNKNSINYNVRVSGHCIDEKEYYDNRVAPLYSKLFGIEIMPTFLKENEYGFAINSKAIFGYITKILKFPSGEKSSVLSIPKPIKEAGEEVVNSFLRGLFDTDGYFHFRYNNTYPVFQLSSASKTLISEVKNELLKRGFDNISCIEAHHNLFRITIQGHDNLDLWRNTIGAFSSPKHETKYLLWKKNGCCPFNTTTPERQRLININFDKFNGRFL